MVTKFGDTVRVSHVELAGRFWHANCYFTMLQAGDRELYRNTRTTFTLDDTVDTVPNVPCNCCGETL
jgi:ribosome-binding factor A